MGKRQRSRDRRPAAARRTTRSATAAVPSTGRVTPKAPAPYFRPEWHRPIGWFIVALGLLVVIVNDLAYFDIELMPGGHSELYLFLGIGVAAGGTWFLGLFDRPV